MTRHCVRHEGAPHVRLLVPSAVNKHTHATLAATSVDVRHTASQPSDLCGLLDHHLVNSTSKCCVHSDNLPTRRRPLKPADLRVVRPAVSHELPGTRQAVHGTQQAPQPIIGNMPSWLRKSLPKNNSPMLMLPGPNMASAAGSQCLETPAGHRMTLGTPLSTPATPQP